MLELAILIAWLVVYRTSVGAYCAVTGKQTPWVAAKTAKLALSDKAAARRYEAQRSPRTLRGFLAGLWGDMWEDAHEARRENRLERQARRLNGERRLPWRQRIGRLPALARGSFVWPEAPDVPELEPSPDDAPLVEQPTVTVTEEPDESPAPEADTPRDHIAGDLPTTDLGRRAPNVEERQGVREENPPVPEQDTEWEPVPTLRPAEPSRDAEDQRAAEQYTATPKDRAPHLVLVPNPPSEGEPVDNNAPVANEIATVESLVQFGKDVIASGGTAWPTSLEIALSGATAAGFTNTPAVGVAFGQMREAAEALAAAGQALCAAMEIHQPASEVMSGLGSQAAHQTSSYQNQ